MTVIYLHYVIRSHEHYLFHEQEFEIFLKNEHFVFFSFLTKASKAHTKKN